MSRYYRSILNVQQVAPALDPDAQAYITAVEAADSAALEAGVKTAINDFVIGCKADGIWAAIKTSCILAGARTLTGALVPLVGSAPTNNNFVSADYNRKTGLIGNGSTKFLSTNRNNNADPQDSNHNVLYFSSSNYSFTQVYMGGNAAGVTGENAYVIFSNTLNVRNRSSVANVISGSSPIGLFGTKRDNSSNYVVRKNGVETTVTRDSQTPENNIMNVFSNSPSTAPTDARIAFYSMGESLNLSLLDARLTTLINAYNTAI
jgi:hypothetical protein